MGMACHGGPAAKSYKYCIELRVFGFKAGLELRVVEGFGLKRTLEAGIIPPSWIQSPFISVQPLFT